MQGQKLLFISFVLIIMLGALHLLAGAFYFYWTVWWFDTFMHFLGGLSIGLFLLWLFKIKREWTVLVLIFAVGAGWEAFEHIFGIANPSLGETYLEDTTFDLIADLFGAFIAAFFVRKKRING